MHDIESLLTRWQSAGVLDADTAARIRAYEIDRPAQPGGQAAGHSAAQAAATSANPAGLK